MLIALICFYVASLLAAVAACLSRGKWQIVFRACTLVCLICLGVVAASYAGSFSGFEIILIYSPLPMLFRLISWKRKPKTKKTADFDQYFSTENAANANENAENKTANFESANTETSLGEENTAQISSKSGVFLSYLPLLIQSLAVAVSGFLIAFCALYLGKESVFYFLSGIALALFAAFLERIILQKKAKQSTFFEKFLAFLTRFLLFLGGGFMLGAIVSSLLYAFSVKNLIYSAGCLVFCAFATTSAITNSKYNELTYCAATMLLFLSILL